MRVRAVPSLITLAAAVAVTIAACGSPVAPTPAPTPAAATASPAPASASPASTLTPTAAPSSSLTPTPTPIASVSPTACQAANLVARITSWEGAMGHQIAHVELTNNGPACLLAATAQPQLVEGHGAVLINGVAAAAPASSPFGIGEVRQTLVQDTNYCGPVPDAPVSVAFVFAGLGGRLIALPLSATDTTGVPGCLSGPGSAGSIEMHEWAP